MPASMSSGSAVKIIFALLAIAIRFAVAASRKAKDDEDRGMLDADSDKDYERILENQRKIREMCDRGEEGIWMDERRKK